MCSWGLCGGQKSEKRVDSGKEKKKQLAPTVFVTWEPYPESLALLGGQAPLYASSQTLDLGTSGPQGPPPEIQDPTDTPKHVDDHSSPSLDLHLL